MAVELNLTEMVNVGVQLYYLGCLGLNYDVKGLRLWIHALMYSLMVEVRYDYTFKRQNGIFGQGSFPCNINQLENLLSLAQCYLRWD